MRDPEEFIKVGLEWLKSLLPDGSWEPRRTRLLKHMFSPYAERYLSEPVHRLYPADDVAGYYLLQAEASTQPDMVGFWDTSLGPLIVAQICTLGRYADHFGDVTGLEARARRMLLQERRQPQGPIFELVVALAYRAQGWTKVEFLPEKRGAKQPDFSAKRGRHSWSVEVKKVGPSQYSRTERDAFWRMWSPVGPLVARSRLPLRVDITFLRPLETLPKDYLFQRVGKFLKAPLINRIWSDDCGIGQIGLIDLVPIKTILATDALLLGGARFCELLLGEHRDDCQHSFIGSYRPWRENPRYVDELDDWMGLARWRSVSDEALTAKSRHILRQLAEANSQLLDGMPGAIHIGVDAMEGNDVEYLRHAKTQRAVQQFHAKGKRLAWVYCHVFKGQSPAGGGWDFDESVTLWHLRAQRLKQPLKYRHVIVPPEGHYRPGGHWLYAD